MSPYFSYNEQKCPCCNEAMVDPQFMAKMVMIREKYGAPIYVNSWYRCAQHDKEVGGKGNHVTGRAIDIKCETSLERAVLMRIAIDHGIERIGIGKTFLHFDIVKDHPTPRFWVYS